jgi:hypothetical protein
MIGISQRMVKSKIEDRKKVERLTLRCLEGVENYS